LGFFSKKFIEINKKFIVWNVLPIIWEKYFHIRGNIHKLFTEIPFFPLAFLRRLRYYILALKQNEC